MGSRFPRHPEAFSLDRTTKRRDRRHKEPGHLSFIRSLCCTVCGSRAMIEAAHVRYRDPASGKPGTAMAQKPDDKWVVPLCQHHHRQGKDAQHNHNERDWWHSHGIDPCAVAIALRESSGDTEAAEATLRAAKKRGTGR